MLSSISNDVEKYTRIIASVTNINLEVVDINLTRIVGTGIYAKENDKEIKVPGRIYRYVMDQKEPLVIENPRHHRLCGTCDHLNNCSETLEVSTPIIYNNDVIGVVAIVCYTEEEKNMILNYIQTYKDFINQLSNVIASAVNEKLNSNHFKNVLDIFLNITDANCRGIVAFNSLNYITYMNDKAREYLGRELSVGQNVYLKKIGTSVTGIEEFEFYYGSKIMVIEGNLLSLQSDDDSFKTALVFDVISGHDETGACSMVNFSSIIGDSKAMVDLKNHVLQIADTNSTILITGESGVGKEVFARAIHENSTRRDKPFVAINCGAIPENLLESELFGYVSGAFTGARTSGHMGKFEMANKGVLFLDEIGTMPLYLQVKLLRVIQEKTIVRLGSNRDVDIDLRIIAATNDNLQELIKQKIFREDLFYRLNVIPINIPPLRERIDDVSLLAQFFLNKYCSMFGKKLIRLSSGVIKTLKTYSWPGNIREFENVMEYLVNVTPCGGYVTVSMLPERINSCKKVALESKEQDLNLDSIVPLDILEKKMIFKAISFYGNTTGGKAKAAKALGIGIATLYRKIKESDLSIKP